MIEAGGESPNIAAIIALGVLLMVIFLIWLVVAEALYIARRQSIPIAPSAAGSSP